MGNWYKLVLGLLSFVGISFAHHLVVKVVMVEPEVEEEVIIVERPRKKTRSIASVGETDPARETIAQMKTEIPSLPSRTFEPQEFVAENRAIDGAPVESTSSPAYTIQNTPPSRVLPSPTTRSQPLKSSGKASANPGSGSKSPGAFGAAGMTFSNYNPASTTSGAKSSTATTTRTSSRSPTSTTDPDDHTSRPTPTPEVLSHKLLFTSGDSSSYVHDPSKLDFSQNFLSLILPGYSIFPGTKIGVEISPLSNGKESLVLPASVGHSAEFNSSWTPRWSDVVGVWHFNEITPSSAPGGSDFADASGFNNHGTRIRTGTIGFPARMKTGIQNI